MENKNHLFKLPDEIIVEIYKELNLYDQSQVLSTSNQIRELLKDEEKHLDKVEIDFDTAEDIKSHNLPRIGTEYKIYPDVFISIDNNKISEDFANIKIEIKNHNNLFCVNNGKDYRNKDVTISNMFINKSHIQFHNYQLYTFTYKKYYYILYIHRENFFLWRTEHLTEWNPTYIYKFASDSFDHIIKKFKVNFFEITLENGNSYFLDIVNFSLSI